MSHYKPYPAYRDSGVEWIGPVPEHWEVKRLEHIADTHRDNVTADALSPYEVLHYSIPSVQETGNGSIEQGTTIDSNKLFVGCPQVLVSKLNPRKGTIVIAHKDPERPTVASTEFVPLIPQRDKSTLEFIASVAASAPLRQLMESRVESATRSHQRVAPEEILKARIATPPITEQTAIATFLDRETSRIDALIAKKTRFIELLKEKRQALITHAVTKGLDPDAKMKDSGVEWIGEVPKHWQAQPIKYLASIGNGSTPSKENSEYWEGGDFPWLTSGCVNLEIVNSAEQFVTDTALRECHLPIISPPAVLVGITGQGKTRGMASTLLIEATINQHIAYIKPTSNEIYIEYLRRFLDAAYDWLRFDSEGVGSTKGAITCEQLANTKIALPPLSEQNSILEVIHQQTDRIDLLTEKTERSIDLLKERRAAFITAAVTGQIDLRESA